MEQDRQIQRMIPNSSYGNLKFAAFDPETDELWIFLMNSLITLTITPSGSIIHRQSHERRALAMGDIMEKHGADNDYIIAIEFYAGAPTAILHTRNNLVLWINMANNNAVVQRRTAFPEQLEYIIAARISTPPSRVAFITNSHRAIAIFSNDDKPYTVFERGNNAITALDLCFQAENPNILFALTGSYSILSIAVSETCTVTHTINPNACSFNIVSVESDGTFWFSRQETHSLALWKFDPNLLPRRRPNSTNNRVLQRRRIECRAPPLIV